MNLSGSFALAVQDFRRARRSAAMQEILARLTGHPVDLLPYDEVRRQLRVVEGNVQELKDVPLDAIVGSVGRYTDFTRSFLPRKDSDEGRWARVKVAADELSGLPPIEVYQLGEVYFVRDGNHRVSVAREEDAPFIQAYVTPVYSAVPIDPEDDLDRLILKAEYSQFLAETGLHDLRPGADLTLTVPGRYDLIREHIQVHRYFMGIDQQRDITGAEAVAHWYDTVYLPLMTMIRERRLLRDFPGRTEADLYVWTAQHRAELEAHLGWVIPTEKAAADLADHHSPRPEKVLSRMTGWLWSALHPDEWESGPPPGAWRRENASHAPTQLFSDILVAVTGPEQGWDGLDQALSIVRRENARLMGLHVAATQETAHSEAVQEMQDRFADTCAAAGVIGQMAVEVGPVAKVVCERAQWADLVVLNMRHPIDPTPMARLGHGLRTILRRCSRPVLVVPGAFPLLDHPLLAFDGSPRAWEALYVATYLTGSWQTSLTVLTVHEAGRQLIPAQEEARAYLLARGIGAQYLSVNLDAYPAPNPQQPQATPGDIILQTAAAQGNNLLILGGYSTPPMVEVMLGSTVEQILREATCPMLFCR